MSIISIPAPYKNGPGTPVDISALGARKVLLCQGTWKLLPTINLEINNAALPHEGAWSPVVTFQGAGGPMVFIGAARWIRANMSNYRGGERPVLRIAGTDEGCRFVELPVPYDIGVGDPIEVDRLGPFRTVHAGGGFAGSVIVELAHSEGGPWQQPFVMRRPGHANAESDARWARVKRSHTSTLRTVPMVTLGGTVLPIDISMDPIEIQYTATGLEGLDFRLQLGTILQNSRYRLECTPVRCTNPPTIELPTGYGDRTLTCFRVVVVGDGLDGGDVLRFVVTPC